MQTPDRFSDLRVLRWFDRIDQAIAGEPVGPIRASVDLTNLCSHNCPWCEPLQFREETIVDQKHTMQASTAHALLGDLADMGCKTINFSGGGEPTLHPYFGALLKRAVDLQMRTWIVTHGGLMHRHFEHLLLADHVRISLDASNEAEHMEMHGSKPGEFGKVCENIAELCKRRVKPGALEVGIAYIVADCNSSAGSIRSVLEFAASNSVDFIHFRPLSEDTPARFTEPWEQVASTIERIACDYPSVKVFPLSKRSRDVFQQREFESCYSAFTNAVISANGEVCACCDRRDIVFGNVNEESFKSIWLSAKHRAKAEAIEPKLCTRCLMCGYNRAVEKFVVNNEALPELM